MKQYFKIIDGEKILSWCQSVEMPDGRWVSNPTEEQISEAGWEEYIPIKPIPNPIEVRKAEIKAELASLDYLTSKYIDGEDMSEYGDWQQHRRDLRAEYNRICEE